MTVDQQPRESIYRCEPFEVGREGGLHLWSRHDVQGTVHTIFQAAKHDHLHANGLADHTYTGDATDQPEAGVTA